MCNLRPLFGDADIFMAIIQTSHAKFCSSDDTPQLLIASLRYLISPVLLDSHPYV